MIDPHVHCRDWKQNHKETISHALYVAERAGLVGIFDMPNTDPAMTTRELVETRLEDARKVNSPVFYGLYIGLTKDPAQIKEAVQVWEDLFPAVVGLKMFAGHSVGNLGVIQHEDQRQVYQTLTKEKFDGVLAVHCEKEFFLHPKQWNPQYPITHSLARPQEAEVNSVYDQIRLSEEAEFQGNLHICHVSVPGSIEGIEKARKRGKIKITCGITPHHALLNYEMVQGSKEGLIYKVNPPLRDKCQQGEMLALLRDGKIDWIETDHAPHTLAEKTNAPYMSGFPGLPFYPHFMNYLEQNGFSKEQIRNLTYHNICDTFKIGLPKSHVTPDMDLHTEYEVDVYKNVRKNETRKN